MKESILNLLEERYFPKGEKTWEELCKRVSKIYPEIYEDMLNMRFIASSPTLMNAFTDGRREGTLSSCFPMKIEGDSIKAIYEAIAECAEVTKNSGGVGYDGSFLRSSLELIKTLNANSSGPLPFISDFNSVLDSIRQGGVRKGAGSFILDTSHPNILDFIRSKDLIPEVRKLVKEGKIKAPFARINFSVKARNEFYYNLDNNPNAIHQVKLVTTGEIIDLEDNGKKVTVKELWDEIIEFAWRCAEPGIFNYDIAWDRCSVKNVDNTVLGNPCFEFVNIPYASCNLGSINLSKFVENGKFNWIALEKQIKRAVIFLNHVIDINKFPIAKIKEITMMIRPIGLGEMGLAHAMYKLGIPYNSIAGLEFTEQINRYLTLKGMEQSIELAKKNGPYPAFNSDIFMKANERFFKYNKLYDINVKKIKEDIDKYGIRNSCITSIAPTGTISVIAETSGGIEPVFSLAYKRKIEQENNNYKEIEIKDPVFEEYLEKNYPNKKNDILEEVYETGSCQESKILTDREKSIFVVANDLTPMEHLNILEKVANNISLSVSKTINLPIDISKEEISKVYREAHKKGIIGVTVYREGSREGILINNKDCDRCTPKRPKIVKHDIHRITVKGEKWIVFVGLDEKDNEPFEVFAGKIELVDIPSKIQNCNIIKAAKRKYQIEIDDEIIVSDLNAVFDNKEHEVVTRLLSLHLRNKIPIHFIIEQINKSPGQLADFEKCIARALKKYIKEGTKSTEKCPKCGLDLIFQEGCVSCVCGFSKCG